MGSVQKRLRTEEIIVLRLLKKLWLEPRPIVWTPWKPEVYLHVKRIYLF